MDCFCFGLFFCLFQGNTHSQRSIFLWVGLCFVCFRENTLIPKEAFSYVLVYVFVSFRENTLAPKEAFSVFLSVLGKTHLPPNMHFYGLVYFLSVSGKTHLSLKSIFLWIGLCVYVFQVKHTYPLRSIFFWIGLHVFVWFRENTFTSKEVFSYGLVYLLSVSGKIHLPLKKHFLMNWFMCF